MVTVWSDSKRTRNQDGCCCYSLQTSAGQHSIFSQPTAGPSALPIPLARLTYVQAVNHACYLLEGAVVGRQLWEQREGGCMVRQ